MPNPLHSLLHQSIVPSLPTLPTLDVMSYTSVGNHITSRVSAGKARKLFQPVAVCFISCRENYQSKEVKEYNWILQSHTAPSKLRYLIFIFIFFLICCTIHRTLTLLKSKWNLFTIIITTNKKLQSVYELFPTCESKQKTHNCK